MCNSNTDGKVTYHYSNRSPFLFLEIIAPLPAFTWMLGHASSNGDIDALSMPKIAQNSRNRPKGHHVHDMENEVICEGTQESTFSQGTMNAALRHPDVSMNVALYRACTQLLYAPLNPAAVDFSPSVLASILLSSSEH